MKATIVKYFPSDTAFVCSTGKSSRELFTINHSNRNFYMVGSMGCASAIGLGIAKNCSKRIIVIEGDGALLMRMGNMATIGYYSPPNLCHVLINNGIHDSTGGQKTASDTMDYGAVALASNYNTAFSVSKDLETCFDSVSNSIGPHFIEIKAALGSIEPLGRPDIPLPLIATRFSAYLQDID